MARVVLKKVKKIYSGNVVAVHDFNLDIADQEFVVFVGPSGCGKSTTLRMIAGLEDISEGTVEIDGVVVNDLQPKDRGISMVFQNYALYPHLTVFENMAFPLRLQHMKYEEIYKRVINAAKILGITEYLTRKPKALSGGQRQRVAIGRAMVKDSKVFLMDEPLSNLDAKLRNQMRAEIILLHQRMKTTFIYVTHDQTEAMTLGDRIVIMKDGLIMQVGTPSQVFDKPANLFVAEFIGAPKMNTFPAVLAEKGGKYKVSAFGTDFPITGPKAQELADAGYTGVKDIILGVRPEHTSLKTAKDADHPLEVNLEVNEMMGSEYHLHTLTADGHEIIVRTPTIDLTAEEKAALVPGASLYLGFEGKVMHFFDTMNTFPATLTEKDGEYTLNILGHDYHIEGEKAQELAEAGYTGSTKVIAGFHHENVTVSASQDEEHPIEATLKSENDIGGIHHLNCAIHAESEDKRGDIIERPVISASSLEGVCAPEPIEEPEAPAEEGLIEEEIAEEEIAERTVYLHLDLNDLSLFDKASVNSGAQLNLLYGADSYDPNAELIIDEPELETVEPEETVEEVIIEEGVEETAEEPKEE